MTPFLLPDAVARTLRTAPPRLPDAAEARLLAAVTPEAIAEALTAGRARLTFRGFELTAQAGPDTGVALWLRRAGVVLLHERIG